MNTSLETTAAISVLSCQVFSIGGDISYGRPKWPAEPTLSKMGHKPESLVTNGLNQVGHLIFGNAYILTGKNEPILLSI